VNRIAVWRWLTQGIPAGQILPPWLSVCQIVLFPKRTLLWMLSRDCGFDLMTACWTIHGVRFSDRLFMAMAQPRQGVLYRFERKAGSDLVWVTEVRTEDLPLPLPEVGK